MPLKEKAGDDAFGSGEIAVDAFPDSDGFLLTIGHTSIWLDRGAAQEILSQLDDALTMGHPRGLAWEESN
jgi:hypothetical protein